MHSVCFTAETSSNGVLERDFTVGEVPGVLWSPASGSGHAPVVLMGHGGGLHKKTPALVARAHDTVTTWGFTVAAIDAPGHGDRPRTASDELFRAEFRRAQATGDRGLFESVSVRYALSLAERAVPEWRATLDALQKLPEIGTEAPIGYGGGISLGTAIGVPLTAIEPRIAAAVFGGGFFVYDAQIETDHRPGPLPAPVGRRVRRPRIRSRVVRRLRLDGEDAARQPGRPSHDPLGRARPRVPGPASRRRARLMTSRPR